MIREHLPKRGVVAEVGLAEGDNARTILEGAEPRELHLIDLDLSVLKRHSIEPALRDGIVRLHEKDSVAALASFPDEYFDWIYIDGDHSYPGVKRDIEQAKRAVKRDGLLVFDDYPTPMNAYACQRRLFSLRATRHGVGDAVNELCLAEDWGFRYLALNRWMHWDVALARQAD